MTRTFHDEVGPEAADDLADRIDPRLRRLVGIDRNGGVRPELAAEGQPGFFWGANGHDLSGTHFLCSDDGQNADRPRTLYHDCVPVPEASSRNGPIDAANAGGQGFRERSEHQRHIIRQSVNLGRWQHVQIHIDHFCPAPPEMGRFFKWQVAAIVGGVETLVGVEGVVHAVVAHPAGHQGRKHDFASFG